ncbi:sigma 54-interacting transcriptional regulator [Sporomusa acidovorans]|uniref:Acetoin dehydrogenase operon transcriptional activator AcoR n=1 Tax=Sporomusa acidovorans (strain ATCC 49682 / DSM 3132 / Mol) TaxID=1123286 RepID=A0ABZ3JC70_SPOA4|nr:sigma 54-interacting transcriptional regulator [Sporomusa acidovorans]OZC13213.1 acetoin dehydrogenase operon transcriptional activator AcoR [Sporomusa acidovorans DSM 3132]SDE00958.1 Transcriptional regulator containing PAS, AAA-type ATPase, and DNA-binding Fis domains [Sporomusa acidovorans]
MDRTKANYSNGVQISTTTDNNDPLIEMNLETWNKIKNFKTRFISSNEDPKKMSFMNLDVAKSWSRSKKYGVDPYMQALGSNMNPQEFRDRINNKKMLIETAVPFIKKYYHVLANSDYYMILTDETGTILFTLGEQGEANAFYAINARPGAIWSEQTIGTTAHALSIQLCKPVQLAGPYNYCMVLQDNISSSTPIVDETGDIIGTLVVVQMTANRNINKTQIHSLGWVISMGYAIENELQLRNRNHDLNELNDTLQAILSAVDEGFITLNNEGIITHINKEAAKIFGKLTPDIENKHFTELMSKQIPVDKVLETGKPIHDYEATIVNDKSEVQYLITIEPILNETGEFLAGAVMRFSRSEKINRLVTHRGGTEATYTFNSIIGESTAIKKTIKDAIKVSQIPACTLLMGESGTGKELFAQAIHNNSRPEGPFVALNCASIPRNLIESELFGYEAGSFTGAERRGRPGKIELANGGTLFLDEIGDMPIEIQPVLLRCLQDKKVLRLGGNHYIPVDFRVIAATNKDLYHMVQEKQFREDLYFRLAVFKIMIPPLRSRDDDIILLTQYFIEQISQRMGLIVPRLSKDVLTKIKNYSWPGNIRQLENAMVYAVNMAQDGLITMNNLPDEIINDYHDSDMDSISDHLLSMVEIEKRAIKNTLKHTGYNVADTADILEIGKTTLYRKFKEYDIVLPK